MLKFGDIVYYTDPNVYDPAEDTFLLAKNLKVKRREEVLEIGVGTGIITILASRMARKVVGTDINPHAIKCAAKNVINNRAFNVELKEGDLFQPLDDEKFDLIIFNTPYLPTDEEEKVDDDLEAAWDGGTDGREVIDQFLDQFSEYLKNGGRVQLVQSSLSDVDKTLKKLEELGFQAEVTDVEKCFFEEITLITGFKI